MHSLTDAISAIHPGSSRSKLTMWPFTTLGGAATPEQFRNALGYIEYLWNTEGMYKSALQRVIAFNITELRVMDADTSGDLGREERIAVENSLRPILEENNVLVRACEDLVAYGNGFRSIIYPFIRMMICPSCKQEYSLDFMLNPANKETFNPRFAIGSLEVHSKTSLARMGKFSCPSCSYRGDWFVNDRETDIKDGIFIKAWRPQDILIETGAFNGKCRYHLRLNAADKKFIEDGHPLTITTWPMEIMLSVKRNKMFQFNDRSIYHLKEGHLSGLQTYGWGIPRALAHFKLVWYVAALYKINEALAVDYSIPKRVITPAPRTGASDAYTADPAGTIDLSRYLSRIQQMFTSNDPGQVDVLPFPIQYMLLGGEAKQLVPDSIIQAGEDALLNAMNCPAEFYRATLQLQATPMATSIFENTWRPLRWSADSFLKWIKDELSMRLKWSPVRLSMRPLKMAADIERQMLYSQLAAQGTISWTSAMDAQDMDYIEEQRRLIDEQKYIAKLQAKLEEEMATKGAVPNITKSQNPAAVGQPAPPPGDPAAMGGAPPMTGGGGGAAGGNPQMDAAAGLSMQTGGQMGMGDMDAVTPQDVMQYADQIASQIYAADPTTRRQMLSQYRANEPSAVYDAIKGRVQQLDSQARSQGAAMMKQQGMMPQ